jgi:uncharacterized integral membrane protein
MKYMLSVIKLIFVVALVLFAVFNQSHVQIVVIPGRLVYNTYMFVPILGALVLGGVITALVFLKAKLHFGRSMKLMRKTLKEREDELARLHNVPLMKDE